MRRRVVMIGMLVVALVAPLERSLEARCRVL
jgi:hypothetical protein